MRTSSADKPDIAVTSIKVDREKLAAFRRVAESQQRSVSAQLRWLIDQAIKENA